MSNNAVSPSVNDEIYACLDLDNPKSFFLFAGAGSGKTRSLVEVLKQFRQNNIKRLRTSGKKVAIITYTNAACDEIKRRLDFDSAFYVSTIHSFAWELIKPYTDDIKKWVRLSLETEIADLEAKQGGARSTISKTYIDRSRKIESKKRRLDALPLIKKFIYNPNGDNIGRDSLNHTEVICISADFIHNRPLMQSILVRKYPILLIDESQDTKKELMDAFFKVQEQQSCCFSLGMFGDTMQRIYTDGKPDLGEGIPDSWAKPSKTINYRCPKRVIKLINKIRADVDGKKQEPGKDEEGVVRFFIVDTSRFVDKAMIETELSSAMVNCTGDHEWTPSLSVIKVLTLEHHMAASRGGFSQFFDSLYAVDKYKTGLLDGTLSSVTLFANQVLPLIDAKISGDEFAVSSIVRKYSPLLKKDVLKVSEKQVEIIRAAGLAATELHSLWKDGADPSLSDILREVHRTGLFQVPEALFPIAERLGKIDEVFEDIDDTDLDPVIEAWETALQCPFSRFKEYVKYISKDSMFGTHQGVKGLEFPRVMVILDDEEARGFMFSYEKLFGAKDLSDTDLQNEAQGKETSIDRTRRLFYVTCSRAEKSLAIVAYTKEPRKVKQYALAQNWFDANEIVEIN
jgi:DNA helicase II / ATP-dependent DNA helicase PcrA